MTWEQRARHTATAVGTAFVASAVVYLIVRLLVIEL